MKYLTIIFSLLMMSGAYAQDNPVDKVEETKTKTIKVNKNGKVVKNKVKVTTTKEQGVETEAEKDSYINNDIVFPKVKVTKTVSVDNDDDPFYDSTDRIVYFTSEDNKYMFSQNNIGFIMSDENKNTVGMATKTSDMPYYILSLDNYSGLGYFNNEGHFVVEYYNSDLKMLVKKEFKNDTEF